MISFVHHGDFKKTSAFLERASELVRLGVLDKYGRKGVEALKKATPRDTGKTAESWGYTIVHSKDDTRIVWTNSNVVDGVNIAIILQYGHGLKQGGYVKGRDYINPALRPIFDEIADETWNLLVRKK